MIRKYRLVFTDSNMKKLSRSFDNPERFIDSLKTAQSRLVYPIIAHEFTNNNVTAIYIINSNSIQMVKG